MQPFTGGQGRLEARQGRFRRLVGGLEAGIWARTTTPTPLDGLPGAEKGVPPRERVHGRSFPRN